MRFLRAVRGAISLAAIWAAASAIVGGAIGALLMVVAGEPGVLDFALGGARFFGTIGAGMGLVFSMAVAGLHRAGEIREMSVWRLALTGVALGAAFPFAAVAVMAVSTDTPLVASLVDLFVPLTVVGGFFGGVVGGLSAATIAIAKRGDRLELESGATSADTVAPTHDESGRTESG